MRGSTQTVDRCTETLNKLGAAITKYNIDLWELFKKYDKSDNYSLDRTEFGQMLRYLIIKQFKRRID